MGVRHQDEVRTRGDERSLWRWAVLSQWNPQGWYSEYVNPYMPTQTPEENWSDHMQSPGWQPLCVWPNVWSGDLQVLKKYGHTWHRMSSLGPGVIKQHKPNLSQWTTPSTLTDVLSFSDIDDEYLMCAECCQLFSLVPSWSSGAQGLYSRCAWTQNDRSLFWWRFQAFAQVKQRSLHLLNSVAQSLWIVYNYHI